MELNEKPNYYAIIPANVRYDKNLRANEKLLYGEITALTNKEGYCWASNNYFANLYGTSPQAISRWINDLANNGYIHIEYTYGAGGNIKERIITLNGVSTDVEGVSTYIDRVSTNVDRGYQQKVKENNTRDNSTLNNNIYTPREVRHKHGEYGHVYLTDKQMIKLVKDYGQELTDEAIKYLDEYIQRKGYKCKDYNLTLRKWVFDAVKRENKQASSIADKWKGVQV